MIFGKLLPREGNFFEMFNQHADRIVEAAHDARFVRINPQYPHVPAALASRAVSVGAKVNAVVL